jgi:hypothetical protein
MNSTELDPNSLAELFARDPLELTDTDVDSIVATMRAQRHRWANEEKAAKLTGRKPNPNVVKNLSLGDLNL